MGAQFNQIKRAYGRAEIRALAEAEGLVHRGSGHNRTECPGCRNGDPRGVSIGDQNGVGVWNCHRDERHRGSAIDYIALARGIDIPAAARILEERAGVNAGHAYPPPPRPPMSPKPPRRPPSAEVADVWERVAKPILDVADVASAWRERGLDPAAIEDRNLARALPQRVALPPWAFGGGLTWSAGTHRLVLPLFDSAGRMASLHARAAIAPAGAPKGLSPGGFEVGGLLFADALAQLMLRYAGNDVHDSWVLIAEGAPDFLTAATQRSDADESAPAVLGVIAGSWTREVAARVPNDSRVLVAVHSDAAGEKYAAGITDSLAGRCRVRRLGRGSGA